MTNPYQNIAPNKFWRSGVVESNLENMDIFKNKFDIKPSDKIATAGSCFAQNISKRLKQNNFTLLDVEPPPKDLPVALHEKYGYSLYSARYGNIYSVKQLRQLANEVKGDARIDDFVWENDGKFFDALRPNVKPNGYNSKKDVIENRFNHLSQVRKMFENLDIFIFTMGLTEVWESKITKTVFPIAPGIIAGTFNKDLFEFHNSTFEEIKSQFIDFMNILSKIRNNKPFKILLTVSPVPLTATATEMHVLSASTYSKSILRSVAGDLSNLSNVDYFPSFEIVTNPKLKSNGFLENLRSVKPEIIDVVMKYFFNAYGVSKINNLKKFDIREEELICEEELLDEKNKYELVSKKENLLQNKSNSLPSYKLFNIEEFIQLSSLSSGTFGLRNAFVSKYKNKNYPLFFKIDGKLDESPLVCNFHGAVDYTPYLNNEEKLPYLKHSWFSSHLFSKSTTISFCDPILYDLTSRAGWLTSENDNVFKFCKEIIKKLNELLKPKKIIFYGGSIGGFSALRMMEYFPNSDIFVFNPQTNIVKYANNIVAQWLSIFGILEKITSNKILANETEISEAKKILNEKGIVFSVCDKSISANFKGKLLYFQDLLDDHHMQHHLIPFLNHFDKKFRDTGNLRNDFVLTIFNDRKKRNKEWDNKKHMPPKIEHIRNILNCLVDNKDPKEFISNLYTKSEIFDNKLLYS
tara:strand:+ start:1239 stop:3314 length:2076 start_codon:yes stop_codon:yes gene_type:complete